MTRYFGGITRRWRTNSCAYAECVALAVSEIGIIDKRTVSDCYSNVSYAQYQEYSNF